jgi:hypothetical protein
VEVEELVILLLKGIYKALELLKNATDVLQVVLLKGLELLNGAKQLDQLGHSSAEEIELSEDLVRRELKLLALWHVH